MSDRLDRRTFLGTVGAGGLALAAGGGRALGVVAEAGPADYTLPPLPYAADALKPFLSKELLTLHHDKHHAGYVRGLNSALGKLDAARKTGDLSAIKALSRAVAFAGSGHVLHTLYWQNMASGRSGKPKGALKDQMVRDFGSDDAAHKQFAAATKAVEGSGWGLMVWEPLGKRLLVLQCEKHQNLTVWGCVPLLVCDVWEHAYYLDYKNDRGAYVDEFCERVNWDVVSARFDAARK